MRENLRQSQILCFWGARLFTKLRKSLLGVFLFHLNVYNVNLGFIVQSSRARVFRYTFSISLFAKIDRISMVSQTRPLWCADPRRRPRLLRRLACRRGSSGSSWWPPPVWSSFSKLQLVLCLGRGTEVGGVDMAQIKYYYKLKKL